MLIAEWMDIVCNQDSPGQHHMSYIAIAMVAATFSIMSYVPCVLWRFCPSQDFTFLIGAIVIQASEMQSCKIVFLIMEEGSNRLGICTGRLATWISFQEFHFHSGPTYLLRWPRWDGCVIMPTRGPCLHMRGYLLCCRGHKNVAPSKSTWIVFGDA